MVQQKLWLPVSECVGHLRAGYACGLLTRDVKAMQKDIRELGLPLYYVLGNHDSNYFRNNPERFSEKEMRELYLPERERIYCRKQGQLPILECGARTAPFSRSEEHASDKLYYRNRFANPVIGHGMECTSSDKLYYYQDFPGKHLRMIFLDSFDPNESVRYGFHEEELDWLNTSTYQSNGVCARRSSSQSSSSS